MKFPSQKTSPANSYAYEGEAGLGKLYEMRMTGAGGSKHENSVLIFVNGLVRYVRGNSENHTRKNGNETRSMG